MRIVLCNAPAAEAEALAETLVVEQLAACVNLMPVQSIYRWAGELQREQEVTLVIKVASSQVELLRQRVVELHSYDVPEVVVLEVDVARSHAPYVAWVRSSIRT